VALPIELMEWLARVKFVDTTPKSEPKITKIEDPGFWRINFEKYSFLVDKDFGRYEKAIEIVKVVTKQINLQNVGALMDGYWWQLIPGYRVGLYRVGGNNGNIIIKNCPRRF